MLVLRGKLLFSCCVGAKSSNMHVHGKQLGVQFCREIGGGNKLQEMTKMCGFLGKKKGHIGIFTNFRVLT
jgi:hypothetical protein